MTIDEKNITQILKRLKIIQNIIEIGDAIDIEQHVTRLNSEDNLGFTSEIQEALKNKRFSSAVALILDFISDFNQITKYEDPAISALQLEIKYLEHQLIEITSEKSEIEKRIAKFNHALLSKLGASIEKLYKLKLRYFSSLKDKADSGSDDQKKFNANTQYQDSRKQYDSYKQQHQEEREKIFFELSEQEQFECKRIYRECAKLCHPNKFPGDEEKQKKGQEIFIQVQLAFERNDLTSLNQIHKRLKDGILSFENTVSGNKELLETRVNELRNHIENIKEDILAYKTSEVYSIISKALDINQYIDEQGVLLKAEIKDWEEKLATYGE